jgi:hypothetical protein
VAKQAYSSVVPAVCLVFFLIYWRYYRSLPLVRENFFFPYLIAELMNIISSPEPWVAACISSAVMLSKPGGFLALSLLIAFSTSSIMISGGVSSSQLLCN